MLLVTLKCTLRLDPLVLHAKNSKRDIIQCTRSKKKAECIRLTFCKIFGFSGVSYHIVKTVQVKIKYYNKSVHNMGNSEHKMSYKRTIVLSHGIRTFFPER